MSLTERRGKSYSVNDQAGIGQKDSSKTTRICSFHLSRMLWRHLKPFILTPPFSFCEAEFLKECKLQLFRIYGTISTVVSVCEPQSVENTQNSHWTWMNAKPLGVQVEGQRSCIWDGGFPGLQALHSSCEQNQAFQLNSITFQLLKKKIIPSPDLPHIQYFLYCTDISSHN